MSFISLRARKFESSGIRRVFDLAATLKNPINFSIGQPDFGTSKEVKRKTIEAINKDLSKYTPTQGIKELREKVSNKFKESNINANAEEIIITPGTSAGIFLALSTILDPGDEIIIPDPYFVIYPELVKFLDGKPVFLNTYPTFQIDLNKLRKLVTQKTKAIIINSPNNPTGAVYSEQTLKELAKMADKNNIVLISDEIYQDFIYDGIKHFSIGSVYKNTITISGLSKSGGMPGWRLGWATGPKEIIEKMKELQQYIFVCAPSLVQYGALAAFNKSITPLIKQYQKKRDIIFNLLSKKYEIVKPQGAFYLMIKVGSGRKFSELAIKHKVLLVAGNAFSKLDTHIRISYATSEDILIKGSQILLSLDF